MHLSNEVITKGVSWIHVAPGKQSKVVYHFVFHDKCPKQTTKVENRTEKMGVEEKRQECMRKYESNLEIIEQKRKEKMGQAEKSHN